MNARFECFVARDVLGYAEQLSDALRIAMESELEGDDDARPRATRDQLTQWAQCVVDAPERRKS